MKPGIRVLVALLPPLAIASCTQPQPVDASAAAQGPAMAAATRGWPHLIVHKTPTCGCCGHWVAHMEQAGFTVDVRDHDHQAMAILKARLGVPLGKQSCHTAEVGGYVLEGHVPAQDVKRLLAERPAIRGLTVPGMPAGSPGMEMPDGRVEAYAVEAMGADGTSSVYARHGK